MSQTSCSSLSSHCAQKSSHGRERDPGGPGASSHCEVQVWGQHTPGGKRRGREGEKGGCGNDEEGCWLPNQNGTILGYRYKNSPVVVHETVAPEPARYIDKYTPTTWLGGSTPHVWLRDGMTSIFDLLGQGFNVVDFTRGGGVVKNFECVGQKLGLPLRMVHLPGEGHARNVCERGVVVLRPDQHVAWH